MDVQVTLWQVCIFKCRDSIGKCKLEDEMGQLCKDCSLLFVSLYFCLSLVYSLKCACKCFCNLNKRDISEIFLFFCNWYLTLSTKMSSCCVYLFPSITVKTEREREKQNKMEAKMSSCELTVAALLQNWWLSMHAPRGRECISSTICNTRQEGCVQQRR